MNEESNCRIFILPELRSNGKLLRDFQNQLSLEVDLCLSHLDPSHRPIFIIFRPQGRPRDEFQDVVQAYIDRHGLCQDEIFLITAFNNDKGNISYIEGTGHRFKVIEKIILLNGSLDVTSNQQTFKHLARTLIHDYDFKEVPKAGHSSHAQTNIWKFGDRVETVTETVAAKTESGSEMLNHDEMRDFNCAVEKTIAGISEIGVLLSVDDLGEDLAGVQDLRRKHDDIENHLMTLEKEFENLQNQASTLQHKLPNMVKFVGVKIHETENNMKRVKQQSTSRSLQLEESFKLQTFLKNAHEMIQWSDEMDKRMKLKNFGIDVTEAATLLKTLEEFLATITSRIAVFSSLRLHGSYLLKNNPFAAEKVQKTMTDLDQAEKTVTFSCDIGKEHVFNGMVEKANAGLASMEGFLTNENLGRTRDEIEHTLAKHDEVHESVVEQEKVINDFAATLCKQQHFASDEIKSRCQALVNRRETIEHLSENRRIYTDKYKVFLEKIEKICQRIRETSSFDESHQETAKLLNKFEKHNTFEKELITFRKDVDDVYEEGRSLLEVGHHDKAVITEKLDEMEKNWRRLMTARRERRDHLQEMLCEQVADHLSTWIDEVEAQIQDDKCISASSAVQEDQEQMAYEMFMKSIGTLKDELKVCESETLVKMYKVFRHVEKEVSWIQDMQKKLQSVEIKDQVKKYKIEIAAHESLTEPDKTNKCTFGCKCIAPEDFQSRLNSLYGNLNDITTSRMQSIEETLEANQAKLLKHVTDNINTWMKDVESQLKSENQEKEFTDVSSPAKSHKDWESAVRFRESKRELQLMVSESSEEATKMCNFFNDVDTELSWIQETHEQVASSTNIGKYQALLTEISAHKPYIESVAQAQWTFGSKSFSPKEISERLYNLYIKLEKKTESKMQKLEKSMKDHQAKLIYQVTSDLNIWMDELERQLKPEDHGNVSTVDNMPDKGQDAVHEFHKSKQKLTKIIPDSSRFFCGVKNELQWIQEKCRAGELIDKELTLPEDQISKYQRLKCDIEEYEPIINCFASDHFPVWSTYFETKEIQSKLTSLYKQLEERTTSKLLRLIKMHETQKASGKEGQEYSGEFRMTHEESFSGDQEDIENTTPPDNKQGSSSISIPRSWISSYCTQFGMMKQMEIEKITTEMRLHPNCLEELFHMLKEDEGDAASQKMVKGLTPADVEDIEEKLKIDVGMLQRIVGKVIGKSTLKETQRGKSQSEEPSSYATCGDSSVDFKEHHEIQEASNINLQKDLAVPIWKRVWRALPKMPKFGKK